MLGLLIKASILIFVLWCFYRLFLQKESFFAANRFYLLACLLMAFILPFISLPELMENQGIITTLIEPAADPVPSIHTPQSTLEDPSENFDTNVVESIPSPEVSAESPAKPTRTYKLGFWLLITYLFGVLIFSLNLVSQIISVIFRVIKSSDSIKDIDCIIVNSPVAQEPCSFFNYIFINPEPYDLETYEQIIAHEKVHVNQLHSIDLLLSELAVIALWFNPFIWFFRKEVEKNIEYQTDVLLLREKTVEKQEYQLNLLKVATYSKPLSITTNYNQSLIKHRILMMNAKRSNPHSYWKYAFLAPLLFATLLVLNKPLILQAQQVVDQPLASIENEIVPKEDGTSEEPAEQGTNDILGAVEADVSATDLNCKALLKAIKEGNTELVKDLIKTTDVNCIDPNPESDVIVSGGSTYIMTGPRTPLVAAARTGNVAIGELLIKAQADVKFRANNDPSPLMSAASFGSLDFVQLLISNGADINRAIPNEGTPLIAAARRGRLEVVKYLHTQGADLNAVVHSEGSPILVASRNGHLATVQYLHTQGADIHAIVSNEGSPVLVAARNGHRETVKFLHEKGADINATVPGEGTPLLVAARNGHTKTMQYLISNGADVNAKVSGEGTALLAASQNGNREAMEFLLKQGANVNAIVHGEGSPLLAAARNGHIEVIEFLVSQGADINARISGEGTPLLVAARNGHTATLKYLISKGAEVNAIVDGEGTALLAAARNGQKAAMELLLTEGAEINAKVPGEGSALIAAARNGHLETVKYLLARGADINGTVNGEGSPLLVASRNGHQELVVFLISKGATVDLVTEGEGTALVAAVRNHHYEVAKTLLDHGADPYFDTDGEEYPMYHARRANDKAMINLLNGYEKDN